MGRLGSIYLCFYNILLFGIHLFLFYYIFATHLQGTYEWDDFGALLKLGTAAQFMDIPHSYLGLTRTSVVACLTQVLGRSAILFIVEGNPHLHSATTTLLLLFAYLGVELIRYPFYSLKAFDYEIASLTWLRYSAWIFFYPLGLSMEAMTMLRSIPYYYASGRYSLVMPNRLNIAFNMGVFLTVFVSTCFLPICLFLLGHMNKQRNKKFPSTRVKQT